MDTNTDNIVKIEQVLFKGKRNINWSDVEQYLDRFRGCSFIINETQEEILLDRRFVDEYCGSQDTHRLKGAQAKAKANAVQGIQKIVESATNKRFQENFKPRHAQDACFGWFRYTSRFSLPTYGNSGEIKGINVFRGELLVRHAKNGKLYLYDFVNIKKETSNPL